MEYSMFWDNIGRRKRRKRALHSMNMFFLIRAPSTMAFIPWPLPPDLRACELCHCVIIGSRPWLSISEMLMQNLSRNRQSKFSILNPWFHHFLSLCLLWSLERRGDCRFGVDLGFWAPFRGPGPLAPAWNALEKTPSLNWPIACSTLEMYLTVRPLSRENIYPPTCIKRTRTWALVPIKYPNIPKYTIDLIFKKPQVLMCPMCPGRPPPLALELPHPVESRRFSSSHFS